MTANTFLRIIVTECGTINQNFIDMKKIDYNFLQSLYNSFDKQEMDVNTFFQVLQIYINSFDCKLGEKLASVVAKCAKDDILIPLACCSIYTAIKEERLIEFITIKYFELGKPYPH